MIRMTADKRAAFNALKRQLCDLTRPEKQEAAAERKAAAKARRAALVRAPGQRTPRVQEPAYLAWIRRQPCAVADAECSGPVEAAHLRFSDAVMGRINPGMQRKPDDRWCLPLCRHHHQHDQHRRNERAFWAERGIEPGALCLSMRATYDADAGPAATDGEAPATDPKDTPQTQRTGAGG